VSFANKPWERSARRAVRAVLRRSRAQWKEYRKRRTWLPVVPLWSLVVLIPLAVFLWRLGATEIGLARISLAACLYASATVFFRMASYEGRLYSSPDRTWALHVPVADRQYFDYASLQSLKGSLFVLVAFLMVYAIHADLAQGSPVSWTVIVVGAALQWAAVLAMVAAGLVFWPKPSITPGFLLVMVLFAVVVSPVAAHNIAPILVLLPAGWIHRMVDARLADPGMLAAALTLLALLLGAVVVMWRRLRKSYPAKEIVVLFPEQDMDEEAGQEPAEADTRAELVPNLLGTQDWFAGAQERNQILRGGLAAQPWENAGWIERLAVRWMSPREQALLEFASAVEPDAWTRPWYRAWKWLAAGFVLALIQSILPDWLRWLPLAPPLVAFLSVSPIFGGAWALFQTHAAGLQQTSVHPHYPVGYFETSRVILKMNLARFLAAIPVVLLAGGIAAASSGNAILDGGLFALKVILIAVALQLFLVAAKFSSGTNDTKALSLGTLWLIAVGLFSLSLLVVSLVAFLALSTEGRLDWAAVALGVMAMVSFGFWRFYGRRFERGRIDTVTAPPRLS
jgi:hypothetical protein